ncbi:hypothetical protein ACNPNU_05040 [Pseudomonas shirazica]|uniref:hypothetical protein n=1 Tax=Pseudomonas shirazica TaxID=1940636 RepID=UPI003AABCF3E
MSSKWKIVTISCANLDNPNWTMMVNLAGPLGAQTTCHVPAPSNIDSMTFKQIKDYALAKWEEANA